MRISSVSGVSLAFLFGCSGATVTNSTSSTSGGHSSTAASSTAQGGSTASSGGSSSATGGASIGSGGSSSKAAGGSSVETGGSTATGATKAAGGTSSISTGGSKAVGGTSGASTGGTKAAGGTSSLSTGGTKAVGGTSSVSTGGTKAVGGTSSVSTGGTKAVGGTSSVTTGGTKAVGGTSSVSTGGTTSAGGQASFKCDNLSLAPNTTGDKPTGAAGGLKVLDWAGFKGAVSFTFDDNMTTGSYSKFKATGAHVTLFVTAAMSNYAGYTGAPAAGDEIGNHTSNHSSSGSVSGFESMQSTIQSSYGVTAYTGASPNGDASWSTPAQSFFIANRGVSEADIKPRTATSSLLFNLPAYIPATSSTASTMSTHIKSGIWKVFCVHGWASPAYNPISESEMLSTMTKAVSDGYWAETMGHVAAYFIGQNLISASATTTATWSLPAHFPPNMCVRITTTGGTVTQKGSEVPWDSHGYYQISLDAGEVTIK